MWTGDPTLGTKRPLREADQPPHNTHFVVVRSHTTPQYNQSGGKVVAITVLIDLEQTRPDGGFE